MQFGASFQLLHILTDTTLETSGVSIISQAMDNGHHSAPFVAEVEAPPAFILTPDYLTEY
jgi:hypothetical protein